MITDLSHFSKVFANLPDGVAWAEINADSRKDMEISVKGGKQSGCESLERTILYLRASDGAKTGTVYTELLDEDPERLIKTAINNAAYMDTSFDVQPNKNSNIHLGCVEQGAEMPELLSFALELEAEVKSRSESVGIIDCKVRRTEQHRRVMNSLGMDNTLDHQFYIANLGVSRPCSTGMTLSASARACSVRLQDIDIKSLAGKLLKKLDRMDMGGTLGKTAVKSGIYDCVLSSDVVCNILLTSWQEFSAKNMTTGKSVFSPAQGVQVGSYCLSITDAPSHADWGYYLALDSEGTVCEAKSIVKDGLLVTPLHTLASAGAGMQPPTGNAGRAALLTGTVPVNIVTIPSIFYIEPGLATEDELTGQMRNGILLTYSIDEFHSINIASGEFSIPCGGIVYDNNKPVGIVDQISIAGNLRDLFINIQAVGNDMQFNEFDYKNYCYGGPCMLVKNLYISSAANG